MPVPPPSINATQLVPDFTKWTAFTGFWSAELGASFTNLLLAVFLFSLALKTRSLSVVAVASGVLAGVTGQGWYLLVTALALAGLLWKAWQRSAE